MNALLDQLLDFEDGTLSDEETVKLFARLIRTGLAFTLQGSFGRTAAAFIESGRISPAGEILN